MKSVTLLGIPSPHEDDFQSILSPVLSIPGVKLVDEDEALTDSPDGLIVSWGAAPSSVKPLLDKFPTISWVQLPSAGIESYMDALAAHPYKVWTTAKGSYAKPVAEHALALTLALLRFLPERIRARSWGENKGMTLNGKNVVITGAGGVSLEILRLIKTFDTEVTMVRRSPDPVLGADKTVQFSKFDSVLPDADVLILGSALTPETRNMVSTSQLEKLKTSAYIVNIGRGGLIDTNALVSAITSQQIAGAALDVTDPEPLPDGHPLWDLDDVIITPHSADTRDMIIAPLRQRVATNLKAFRENAEFEGIASPDLGY